MSGSLGVEERSIILGNIISLAGDRFAQVAVPLLILGTEGRVDLAAFAAAANTLPGFLFAGIIGQTMNRRNTRRAIVTSDLARFCLFLLLLIGFKLDFPILGLVAVFFVIGCFDTVHAVSFGTWIPEIVIPEKIFATNKWLEGSDAAVTLVAPLFAAVAILLNPLVAVAINAGSFAVAAAILLLGTKSRTTLSANAATPDSSSGVGLKLLIRKDVRRLLGAYFPLYANSGAALLLFIALSQKVLPGREGLTSLLVSAAGVGGLMCAFVLDRVADAWRSGTVLVVVSCILVGVYFLAATRAPFAVLLVLVAVMDFAVSAGYILVGTIRHLSFQPFERSSISGLIVSINALVMTASAAFAGLASRYLGIRGAIVLLALSTIPLFISSNRMPQSGVPIGALGQGEFAE